MEGSSCRTSRKATFLFICGVFSGCCCCQLWWSERIFSTSAPLSSETSTVTTPVRALFGHKECRLADSVVGTVEDEEEESSEDLARFGPQRDGGWYRSGSDAAAAAAAWAPGGAGAGADVASLAPCEGSLLSLPRDLLTDARGTCHHTAQHNMRGRRRTALANTACTSNGRALEQRQSPCESPLPRSLASAVPSPAPARGPFLFWFGT